MEQGVGGYGAADGDARGAQRLRPPGAMISISSRPIAPSSPACGLRPATARRGRGDAEIAHQRARGDAAGGDDGVGA